MSKPNKHKQTHKPVHYGKKSQQSPPKPVATKPTPEKETVQRVLDGRATLVFHATDTLFFRESRPMEALGEAQSVFPPPVRTLAGAVRTLIGEHFDIQWREFDQKQEEHPLAAHIGFGESLGKLRFQGAWLACDGERLYPAPLHLMRKGEKLFQLTLDAKTVRCDWGENVRLPKLPEGDEPKGSKPLENTWLTQAGLEAVLAGEKPSLEKSTKEKPNIKTQVYFADDLFEKESRLGIARDNATRSVQKGLLYQTQHIRPQNNLSIELDVEGLPDDMPTQAMIRLGGEGRTASLRVKPADNIVPTASISGTKFALYLLTPLYGSPCLDFHRKKCKPTVWQGTLNGIALTLHGAITGKVQRVGGWDMAADKPRPVKSLIPAGSVFFCSVDDGDIQAAINAFHNQHIGDFTEYGYGHLAVGVWNDNEI
ncbi:MAG TPA: type III-B CRISPR module-associated protein Cmr3 [Candidatus Thiothrix moscowensis]|uniref:type III-B CRISPR module-associated protein Cmr3 n=1 Tax=unclassified Thiothrix TaxID=2636184 RepID=UPI0025D5BD98|nr:MULTISPECIES: type III-B CRISPR module-associated protein Cmr3 [unclassified Thiothrix]HRJ53612.1 type III-B CRISPR module-associated protein Cmr3 [Candidatus Thiothrix moscowensis]HRJ93693.1 type III-B CRISPR module-associated protein Cmr3 [Candidatus Thiothrix moscowensis]